MDLDEAVAILYGGSPDDFVSRRTALAAQARAQKDRELAKAVAALRRPTRSAWLVNLLARGAPTDLEALLDLGDALREAQALLAGADLRRLSAERSRAVAALTRRAVALGVEHGYATSDAAAPEVSSTLQAALADPSVGAEVRAGRVAAAATYGGFGPMEWAAMPPSPAPPASLAPAVAPAGDVDVGSDHPTVVPTEDETEHERQAAEAQLERQAAEAEATQQRIEAQEAWEQAQHALEEAEAAAEQATVRADELADALEDLRRRVKETETAEREAREEARAARKRVAPAREIAARARRHVEDQSGAP